MSTLNGGWRSPNIVRDGLVLYLDANSPTSYNRFSSPQTWGDLSGNRNSGSLVNGPTLTDDGGGSIRFDGADDIVTVQNFASSGISGYLPRTIQIWIKDEKVGNYSDLGVICGFGLDGVGAGRHFQICISTLSGVDRKIFLWGNSINYTSTFTVPRNIWTNIAITYVNQNIIAYMNGAPDSGGTLNLNTVPNTAFTFAVSYPYIPFLGKISNALVYNTVLSAQEILQNYNATKTRFGL